MLKLNHVTKTFGTHTVIKDFSYSFPEHGVVALMGASGSGKTTLFNMLCGLSKASGGSIENTYRKTVCLFQEHRLFPWLNVKKNVEIVVGDKEKRSGTALAYLDAVGLSGDLDKMPDELSGGMKQRVALARAFAADADLLILDEPFKELDADSKQKIFDLINSKRASSLIIFSTHDPGDAEILSDALIVLNKI